MRVAANSFSQSLVHRLNQLAVRQYRLQEQAATGQRLRAPEDNPAAMRRVLDLQAEAGSLAQYRRNIERHQEIATASYAAIKGVKTVVDRAREIANLADDLKSPEELRVYAIEVGELLKHAVQLANTKNRGDSLFAGTKTDQPAFAATADPDGRVTAVNYQGNTDLALSDIAPDVAFSVQAPGANAAGSGPRGVFADSRAGADLFAHLIALRDHLAAGDVKAIAATDRPALERDEDNVLHHISANAAAQARLETTAAVSARRGESLGRLISKEADADLAQTIVQLQEIQTAYQAAIQTGGRLLNSSLLNHLR